MLFRKQWVNKFCRGYPVKLPTALKKDDINLCSCDHLQGMLSENSKGQECGSVLSFL